MKRHLKEFGWLYLLCAALLAWPWAVIRMQRPPRLDVETLRKLAEVFSEEFVRHHPDLKPAVSLDEDMRNFRLDARTDCLTGLLNGQASAMPILKPEAEHVEKANASLIKKWDELVSRNVVFVDYLKGSAQESKGKEPQTIASPFPNYLSIQTWTKVQRALAERAMVGGDWDEALSRLRSAARAGNPLRWHTIIGNLVSVACRAIGYGGYETLLHANPPAPVERAALAELIALRKSDPRWDGWVMLSEKLPRVRNLIDPQSYVHDPSKSRLEKVNRTYQYLMEFLQLTSGILVLRERIHNPRLRRWADHFYRDAFLGNGVDPSRIPQSVGIAELLQNGKMGWMTIPAVKRWLNQVIAEEPWVYHTFPISAQAYKQMDPYTLTILSASFYFGNLLEIETRGRVAMTKGRLVELGFAARLYREEHGDWPRSVAELTPAYWTPEREDRTTTAPVQTFGDEAKGPYQPYQIAQREMNNELKAALWDQILPLRNLISSGMGGNFKGDQFEWASPSAPWITEPVRLVAIEQALKAHPKLAQGVQVLLKPAGSDWKDQSDWRPIDPDYARRVTDETDELLQAGKPVEVTPVGPPMPGLPGPPPPAFSRGMMQKGTGGIPQPLPALAGFSTINILSQGPKRKNNPPAAVKVTARLRAPEKAMVIWSAGPDGVDDGGRISYDPTNGTTSRGDLLVFPDDF